MIEREKAAIWCNPTEDAVRGVVEYARSLGLKAVPQYFAMKIVSADGGFEFPLAVGPLRYFMETARRDAMATPGRVTVCFLVRYCDTTNPDEAADYERSQCEAETERAWSLP